MKYFNITLIFLFAIIAAIFLLPPPQNTNAACNPPDDPCDESTRTECEAGSVSGTITGGGNGCPGTEVCLTATGTHTPGTTTTIFTHCDCSETEEEESNPEQTPTYEWSISPSAQMSVSGNKMCFTPDTCGETYEVSVTFTVIECEETLTYTASTTFTSEDDIPPEFSDVPTNTTVKCHSDILAPTVTATDNCDGDIIPDYEQNPPEITTNDCIYTRTWEAEDSCGNFSTTSQVITVESDPPEISDVPEDITIDCPGELDQLKTTVLTATQCDRSWDVDCDQKNADYSDLTCEETEIYLTWTADGICSGSTVVTQKIIYIPRILSAPLYDMTTYKPKDFDYEPCGTLEWSLGDSTDGCSSDSVKAEIDTSTGAITVDADSGDGTVSVTVTDTGTGCSASVDVEIGCSACSADSSDSCSFPGASETEICSWMFEVGLGNAAKNSPVGPLKIYAPVPSPETATPAGLVFSGNTRRRFVRTGDSFASAYAASFRAKAIYNTNGLRQVWAPACLANIIVDTPFKYHIDIYGGGSLYQRNTGIRILPVTPDDDLDLYIPNGPLIVSYTIENPNGTNNYNTLVVTETRPGDESKTTIFSFNQHFPIGGGTAIPVWRLSEGGDAKRIESLSVQSNATEKIMIRTISDETEEIVSQSTLTKQNFPWGYSTVKSVTGSGSESLTNTYSYYTTAGNTSYGQKKLTVNSDGSWTRIDSYDSEARETVVVSSWGNQDATSAASSAKATYYSFAPVDAQDTITERKDSPRTTTVKIEDIVVEKTYNAYYLNASNQLVEITERAYSASAPYGDLNNQRTTRIYNSESSAAGSERIFSSSTSDGTLDTYTYDYGTWTNNLVDPGQSTFVTNNTGLYVRTIATHATTNSPAGIAGKTTRDITIEDPLGRTLMRESYSYMGGTNYQRISWVVNELDSAGKPIVTYNSNGTTTETAWASCGCGKESETDAQGLTTEYQYDDLNRVDFTSRELGTNNIITTYTYDAVGNRLTTSITAGSITMPTTTNTYNLAGRLTTATDTLGITTAYSYGTGYSQVARAGVTNTTVNYLDGRTHYTEQNGERKQTYTYGVNPDGTQWSKTYTGPDGTNSLAWSKTTSDMLGRTTKTERPGFGGTTITNEMFYNTKGQLTKTTSTGSAPTLYEYNELGEQIRTALDINSNGTIDLAGTDRITESVSYYEEINSDYWMTSISKIYAQNNSSAVTTNSIRRNRLTGLGESSNYGLLTSESISIDILGNQTVQQTHIDRSNAVRVELVSTPDSTIDAISTTTNGLLASTQSKTGIITTYSYDALGRRIGTTDPRIGESITHYNSKGQVDWVEDAATNRTAYVYDQNTGRRTAVTNAVGEATYSVYSSEGQLLGTYGSTYPVFYEYDSFDRMSAMYTLRDTNITISSYSSFMNNTSSFDRTSWLYDEATGLLTNKVYHDGKGPSYTYYPNGQLHTRTWARGVTTTYTNSIAGELVRTDYSDDTKTVRKVYNRLGQQTVGIHEYNGIEITSYDPDTLLPVSKTIGCSGQPNKYMYYIYDSLGRQTGYKLSASSSSAAEGLIGTSYIFDDYGQIATVGSIVGTETNTFHYNYLQDSSLVASITNNLGFSISKDYEPNRNLIVGVSNYFGSDCISAFIYDNDALGRRTERLDFDENLFAITNSFAYNGYSELTNAVMNTDNYNYTFDEIGNRIKTFSTVDSVTSETDYLCNALNQYTNITNGAIEEPTYDSDGNMLTNDDWTYTWNGENRLITATNTVDNTYITYSYDYQGRMIKKVTDGETTLFYWNGNYIIAEMTDSSTNFYTWANGETLTASLDGETVFYCHDANKNVTDLVDDSGDSVAHYEYSPFGVITTDPIGSLSTDNPFRFSNEYFDYTTGFVEYKYRKYNPYLGKFLSRDPIDVQGGLNLYAICANDCVNSKDYTGLFSIKKGPVTLGTCGDWGTYADFNDLPGAGWLIQHVKKTYKYTRKCNAAYNYDSRTKKLTAKCECCKDCENAKEVVIDDFYEAFPFFSKSEFQTWDIRDTTSGMEENAECTNGSMMNKKTIVWFGLLPLDGKCPKGFRKRSGKDDPSGASMCTRFDAPDGWDVKKSEASKTYGYTATWNCADNPSEKTKVEEF